ncbi:unnamed protein product [Sphagnum balticum]
MTTESATIQRPARDGAVAFSLLLSAAVVAVPTPFPSVARESRLPLAAAAALALAAIGPAAAATWEGDQHSNPRRTRHRFLRPGTRSYTRPGPAPPAGRRMGIFYYSNYENSSWT